MKACCAAAMFEAMEWRDVFRVLGACGERVAMLSRVVSMPSKKVACSGSWLEEADECAAAGEIQGSFAPLRMTGFPWVEEVQRAEP